MRSHFFYYLNILFFALLTSTITAQPTEDVPLKTLGTISNDGDVMPKVWQLCLDENDQLTFFVNVMLDNLLIEGDYGVLPAIYEDMYVEFTVNGEKAYTQVGNFDIVTLPSGYIVFSYIAESPAFDFSSECVENNDDFVSVLVSYRLVMEVGENAYDTYPACNYQNTLFTCYAYPYAPWCDEASQIGQIGLEVPGEPNPVCYDSWFSGSYAATLHCNCASDQVPSPYEDYDSAPEGDGIDGDNKSDTRDVSSGEIIVYPNPMEDALNIKSDIGSILNIEMYNAKGELIIKNSFSSSENYDVTVNTSELSKGLYLVRIMTENNSKIVKVLK